MNSEWTVLRLPPAPNQYDRSFMSKLMNLLSQCLSTAREPGKLFATSINLSALPTASAGLKAGDVWNDTGTLKIV